MKPYKARATSLKLLWHQMWRVRRDLTTFLTAASTFLLSNKLTFKIWHGLFCSRVRNTYVHFPLKISENSTQNVKIWNLTKTHEQMEETGAVPCPDSVWSMQPQNTALSKLHPTEATALTTVKWCKVLRKSRDKRLAGVSNLVLAALWRASQPTQHHSGG